jgi:peptidoglycan hydrolase-like protein with peptidoglycan-binding domain
MKQRNQSGHYPQFTSSLLLAGAMALSGQVFGQSIASAATATSAAKQPIAQAAPGNLPSTPILLSQVASLRLGARGADVGDLQAQLAELGYYNGSITDFFGSMTEDAVIAFQRSMGMTADGIVGPGTSAEISRQLSIRRGGSSSSTGFNTLQLNDSGSRVEEVQRRLTALGYYNGGISGFFDRNTEVAVVDFQGRNGLTADGVVGQVTYNRMMGGSAAGAASTPSVTTVSYGSRVLQLGDAGEDVAVLQDRLRAAGFFNGNSTGRFGPVTQAAVISFQRSRNLIDDGVVGRQVYNALDESSAGIDPRRDRTSTIQTSPPTTQISSRPRL